MKSNVLNGFNFNLTYARKLIDDLPEDKMCRQPGGVLNHAAWTLGHLAITCDFAVNLLTGNKGACPKEWEELFQMGTQPTDQGSKYPDKQALLKALENGHARLAEAFDKAQGSVLDQEMPVEALRSLFPTVGDAVLFLMLSHEGTHLGELSAWRRAMGLPSVF